VYEYNSSLVSPFSLYLRLSFSFWFQIIYPNGCYQALVCVLLPPPQSAPHPPYWESHLTAARNRNRGETEKATQTMASKKGKRDVGELEKLQYQVCMLAWH
jgi:hypothetical protein